MNARSTETGRARSGAKMTLTLPSRARVVRMTPAAAPYLAGMQAGWSQSLERLGALLPALE